MFHRHFYVDMAFKTAIVEGREYTIKSNEVKATGVVNTYVPMVYIPERKSLITNCNYEVFWDGTKEIDQFLKIYNATPKSFYSFVSDLEKAQKKDRYYLAIVCLSNPEISAL